MLRVLTLAVAVGFAGPAHALAQSPRLAGRVTDVTGAALPGVLVELRPQTADRIVTTTTTRTGDYVVDALVSGTYQVAFILPNFATVTKGNVIVQGVPIRMDITMHVAVSADVTVVGQGTFRNLSDVEDPAANLVGIAQSASQGAITAQQLETRPIMRQGEVLETVPGLIVTQHSGEGKANQYFLRGFNLDHGSDFASTVAGTPVNMPTHAHSQGYSDLNFLIPELVAGVQFSKGPYYADQGDFATAGASNVTYITEVDRPRAQVEGGQYGYWRALGVASPRVRGGRLLVALEAANNAGPWTVPDSFRKLNSVVRFSRGSAVNGLTVTFMDYHGQWNATEASPQRAVDAGLIDRFGSIDVSDGGTSSRTSLGVEWQRGGTASVTKIVGYTMAYRLSLFSNFTFFLDDPVHGDQREQVDRRLVSGGRVSRRHVGRFFGKSVETVIGAQIRNDRIPEVALYQTEERRRFRTITNDDVTVTSGGVYGEATVDWSSWFRTSTGFRGDVSRYRVDALVAVNSGRRTASIASPKVTATFGPWRSTELYVNAGTGFHSNNALGTVLQVDPQGNPAEPVTPLVRAKGAEIGARTVAIPRLQSTVSIWSLDLASELVYNGDLGATEPGPASHRHGIEIANYYRPKPWLVLDLDLSASTARLTGGGGGAVPEAVGRVISAGASLERIRNVSGSVRWRYFGARDLVEDGSVRSRPTSLVNVDVIYDWSRRMKIIASLFNATNSASSDIDYYFASRLPGEPLEGIEDVHSHPAIPRTMRVAAAFSF